jgi:hypothetical protein
MDCPLTNHGRERDERGDERGYDRDGRRRARNTTREIATTERLGTSRHWNIFSATTRGSPSVSG